MGILDRPPPQTMTLQNGRKDAQSARPQMPAAGAAHQKGARWHGGGRRSGRGMHRSAHRHRHPEPAQPDRRYARRYAEGKTAADVSHSQDVSGIAELSPRHWSAAMPAKMSAAPPGANVLTMRTGWARPILGRDRQRR